MNRKTIIVIAIAVVLVLCILVALYGQGLIEMGRRAHGLP